MFLRPNLPRFCNPEAHPSSFSCQSWCAGYSHFIPADSCMDQLSAGQLGYPYNLTPWFPKLRDVGAGGEPSLGIPAERGPPAASRHRGCPHPWDRGLAAGCACQSPWEKHASQQRDSPAGCRTCHQQAL